MTRQASSKVLKNTRTPSVAPADLRGLPTTAAESEAEHASEPVPSDVAQDEANRHLRHRMVSDRAYQIYAQRGYVDGFALADWFQAEAEVDRLLSDRATVN
jgi:hypothetical protein